MPGNPAPTTSEAEISSPLDRAHACVDSRPGEALELTDQAVALAGAAGADAQLATALNPRARLRATVSDISGGKEDGYRALGGGGSFRLALPNA